MTFFENDAARREAFPVLNSQLFLAHAGVTILPRAVADAMISHVTESCVNHQEFGDVLKTIAETRALAAKLIDAEADEVALLGPTSLGLSLFANGIDWNPGDEVVCYQDDYPSNVYPWMNLQRRGVKLVYIETERPGAITPSDVARALTPRTRLVALASCHFLTGYRIDVDAMGRMLHERGILFSLDAIQTLGAFPTSVRHVDFLSADAHKWMLGPMAIGIVYVSRRHFQTCRPTLLGAWNVRSPNYVTQDGIDFVSSAQQYEPGVLNVAGVCGMRAALKLLLAAGIENIAEQLLTLRARLLNGLLPLGFESASPADPTAASGTLTVRHPGANASHLMRALEEAHITASLRHDRQAQAFLRFSPHFYNTVEEMDRVVEVLGKNIPSA